MYPVSTSNTPLTYAETVCNSETEQAIARIMIVMTANALFIRPNTFDFDLYLKKIEEISNLDQRTKNIFEKIHILLYKEISKKSIHFNALKMFVYNDYTPEMLFEISALPHVLNLIKRLDEIHPCIIDNALKAPVEPLHSRFIYPKRLDNTVNLRNYCLRYMDNGQHGNMDECNFSIQSTNK